MAVLFSLLTELKLIKFFNNLNLITGDFSFAIVLTLSTADNNLFGSLFYNVQGKTLQVVGVSNVPDIYTMPFNSLNMRVEKKFGVDRKTALSLKINNILNDTRRSEFVSHGIQSDYFFSRLEEGITFSLGFSRRF